MSSDGQSGCLLGCIQTSLLPALQQIGSSTDRMAVLEELSHTMSMDQKAEPGSPEYSVWECLQLPVGSF